MLSVNGPTWGTWSRVGGRFLRDAMCGSWRDGTDLLCPWSCPVCSADAEGPFCGPCREELLTAAGLVCPRCAETIGPYARTDRGCGACRGHTLGFDAALALGPYEGAIRHLCLLLKHERNAWLARWLADLWVEARSRLLPREALNKETRVAWVPSHWAKRLTRGYDQAETFAEQLADRLGLPLCPALSRVRGTPKLAGLTRSSRRDIMRGAFRARRAAWHSIEGRTILLVDDILTTGATCGAAASALKQAGAQKVIAAVIGRA